MTPDQFLELARVLPEPLILATLNGDILTINRPVATLLKCNRKDLRSKTLLELVNNPPEEVLGYLQACARTRQLLLGSLDFTLPDNESVACRAEGAVIQQGSDESPALILLRLENRASANLDFVVLNEKIHQLSQEIYHRKQIEATLVRNNQELEAALCKLKNTQIKLIQTEKMSSLGQLVAGVAHEINNPITFIHGNLAHGEKYIHDLLQLIQLYESEYPEASAKIQDYKEEIDLDFILEDLDDLLSSMRMGTQRILDIVKSLRNFSRLDESESKAVDVHEGIDSTLVILRNRLQTTLEAGKIEVVRDYGNLPLIECYPGQLNQVFMNLISNAIDALVEADKKRTPEARENNPSQIQISTKPINSNLISISFKDNGLGISENISSHIFDPFFTTKPVGKGTGLGLSISYQIITQLHQGQLVCESIPNQGTEFRVEIPIRQTASKSKLNKPYNLSLVG